MVSKARRIAVIDAETDPFLYNQDVRPFLWGFYDGDDYREFSNARDLFAFLRTQPLIVYAHNGGKFDYTFCLDELDAYSEVFIINGRLAQFKVGECEFRDSFNILPEKLANFAIDGETKHEMDYTKMRVDRRAQHMPEIRRYLRQDCVVLWKVVSAFINKYGRGLTLAGAAMKFWQEFTNNTAPRSSGPFYDNHAPYYCGGRVQCFRSGIIDEHFKVFDINSAYPCAMLLEHPFSVISTPMDCDISEPVIPQSFYDVECVAAGCFPWKDGETLSFPDDGEKRVYRVGGWELQAALDTGAIDPGTSRIHERKDFSRTIDFQSYINHFYPIKQHAVKGSTDYVFAKLMMNSLYGKFGSNPETYKHYGIVPAKKRKAFCSPQNKKAREIGRFNGPWKSAGDLGPWALVQTPATDGKYYNVATAASITSCVRAKLWRMIHAVKAAGGSVLYVDTDSIACIMPASGSNPFAISDQLGDWSDEGTFDRGGIAGKKNYAFHRTVPTKRGEWWKTACKGVRWGADEIMAVAAGAELVYLPPAASRSLFKPPKFITRTIKATG